MGNISQGGQQVSMQEFHKEQQRTQERIQQERAELQKRLDIQNSISGSGNGGGSSGNTSGPNSSDWTERNEFVYGKVNGTPFAIQRSAGSKGYIAGEGTYDIRPSGRVSVDYTSSKTTYHARDNNFHSHGTHWDGSNGKNHGFTDAGKNPFTKL